MQNRIVEIATDNIHLSVFRGFLKLSRDGVEVGRVALPDIGGLVVRGYGASLSLSLAARLAENNIPVILCGSSQVPASVIWPISGHHAQGRIIEAQSNLSLPQRKRLWQSIVKGKLSAQAQALKAAGEDSEDLFEMAKRVRSGDPDNLEAQAARKYWPRMLGHLDGTFSRSRHAGGLNGWLNYGYTVLRAGAARSLLAAGLHPSLSIHHKSRGEPLRLSSDIMEPFRPWLDLTVRQIVQVEDGEVPKLDSDHKKQIVRVLSLDLDGRNGVSTLQTCLDRLSQSLAKVCLGESKKLELPAGLARNIEENAG